MARCAFDPARPAALAGMTVVVALLAHLQYAHGLDAERRVVVDLAFGAMVASFVVLGRRYRALLPGLAGALTATASAPDLATGFRSLVLMMPAAFLAAQVLGGTCGRRCVFDDPHHFMWGVVRMAVAVGLALATVQVGLALTGFEAVDTAALPTAYVTLLAGLMTMLPLWVVMRHGGFAWRMDWRGHTERCAIWLLLVLAAALVFGTSAPLGALAMIPFLLWSAMRLSMIDNALGMAAVAIIAVLGAVLDRGYVAALHLPAWQVPLAILMLATMTHLMNIAMRQQRRLRHGMEQSASRFQAMIEHQPDAILHVDAAGRLLFANPSARRLRGVPSLGECLGDDLGALFRRCMERLDEQTSGMEERQWLVRRDGERCSVVWSVQAFFRQRVLVALQFAGHDCTEAEIAREQLEQQQRNLQALLSNMPGMVYRGLFEADRRLTFVSKGAEALTGLSCAAFLDPDPVPYGSLIHAEDREAVWQAIREAVHAAVPYEVSYRLLRHDGETRWVWERGCLVEGRGPQEQFLEGYIHDINASRLLEVDLRRAMKRVQLADQAKTAFLANMSHDMRTPLNGILGAAELLCQSPSLCQNDGDMATLIRESSQSLLRIITDLLDMTRIESGRFSLLPMPYDPARVIVNAVQNQIGAAEAKQLSVHACVSPGVPRTLMLDGERLGQVVLNLVSNAIKFTDQGGITISLRATQIDEHGVRLAIQVRDTGDGIKPADQERIFQRFSQVDESHTRKQQGVGLGLSISRDILRMMRGDLVVDSLPGRGSVFTATLEVERHEADVLAPALSLAGVTCVLLDDGHLWQDLLAAECRDLGAAVERFDDAHAMVLRMRQGDTDERLAVFAPTRGSALTSLVSRIDGGHFGPACSLVMVGGEGRPAYAHHWLSGQIFARDLADCLRAVSRQQVPLAPRGSLPTRLALDAYRALLSGRRVLLVEDNPTNLAVCRRMLDELGCVVAVADNGQEAVRMQSAAAYDCILMDCQMPVMDGWEAARLIRSAEADGKTVPIVAVTAYAAEDDRNQCSEAGMDDFLPKPIRLEQLADTLCRQCAEADDGPRTRS